MVLMVLQERARWLNLTALSTTEKEDLLVTPITSRDVFGAAVTSVQKQGEEKKQEDEALKCFFPRRASPSALEAQRQAFAQVAAWHPPFFLHPQAV